MKTAEQIREDYAKNRQKYEAEYAEMRKAHPIRIATEADVLEYEEIKKLAQREGVSDELEKRVRILYHNAPDYLIQNELEALRVMANRSRRLNGLTH